MCFAQTAALQKDGRVLSEKQKAHEDVAQREHDASPQESYEMQGAWHSWARIARVAIQVRRQSSGSDTLQRAVFAAWRTGSKLFVRVFVAGRVPLLIQGSENRS